MGLVGKTAIITGAAQGLGRAIAEVLYTDGANLVLVDVNADGVAAATRELDPSEDRAIAYQADVRDKEAFQEAVVKVAARWGKVDILVNNAAITDIKSPWDIEPEEWDEVLAVNLRGLFFGCQVVGAHMRSHGWGRIVNLSSLAAQMPRPSGTHYAASKAGILALTRNFASELAGNQVTVNAVAPAAIEGPMLAQLSDDQVEKVIAGIPVGRLGRPEEVAAMVAFLCGPDAGFITGATFDVNGGVLMR